MRRSTASPTVPPIPGLPPTPAASATPGACRRCAATRRLPWSTRTRRRQYAASHRRPRPAVRRGSSASMRSSPRARRRRAGAATRRFPTSPAFAAAVSWRVGQCVATAGPSNFHAARKAAPSPPAYLPDRYGGRATGHEEKVRRHIVELDAHGNALRQPHPAEGRIDESQQLAAGAAVLILDTVSDTLDVSRQHACITDQFDRRLFADMDALQLGFLEITLDAERVGADQRKHSRTGIDVAPGQEIEIGDDAVDRRHDRRALEVEHRDLERRVRRVEFGLTDVDRLLPL